LEEKKKGVLALGGKSLAGESGTSSLNSFSIKVKKAEGNIGEGNQKKVKKTARQKNVHGCEGGIIRKRRSSKTTIWRNQRVTRERAGKGKTHKKKDTGL